MLVLDERYEVHVLLAPDDEDALAGVAVGIRNGVARLAL